MNKIGGIFAYLFWISIGIALGIILCLMILCKC